MRELHRKANQHFFIPADVPDHVHHQFMHNYSTITRGTKNLVLFACDQKIEHLNSSFYGPMIDPSDNNPEHLFTIASTTPIGACAMPLGLIARYGKCYKNVNYIIKLNSKTNIIKPSEKDPISKQLWTIEQVMQFKQQSPLSIVGVGYTVYIGSEYEACMLQEAANIIFQAHHHGLVTILWMYPRGKHIPNDRDGQLIAGAAGIACALGADFAKINIPDKTEQKSNAELLAIAAQAAGNTKLIYSGGPKMDEKQFLHDLENYINYGNVAGIALGRNLHQRSLADAQQFARSIAAIVYKK